MDAAAIRDEVVAALRTRAPHVPGELGDDVGLDEKGLNLDSIAIVELLADCEERFHVELLSTLLDGRKLTIGRIVAAIRSGRGE